MRRVLILAVALLVSAALLLARKAHDDAGNEVLLFALNDPGAIESLRLHGDGTSTVSPQWFALERGGRIAGVPSRPLLDACRQMKIRVTPAVFNRDFTPQVVMDALQSPKTRSKIVSGLISKARQFHFQGYVIDFENLTADSVQQRRFSDFLGELRNSFHKAKLSLTVALPPPSVRQRQVFDYAAIGRVADRVVLMAYDQHGRFNEPGPIAGYGWVDQILRDTVMLVPPRKLLLGVAFYHRNWSETGATSGTYRQALELQRQNGVDLRWDATHRETWFGFVREGRAHTVWVEDAPSVAEKLALARTYGLAGIAGWRLGQEDPRIWVMLKQFRSN